MEGERGIARHDVQVRENTTGWQVFDELERCDPVDLTDWDRQLLALGELRNEVNNGGFHQYFFNTAGERAEVAVEAAIRTKQTELAILVERAIAVLGTPYPIGRSERQDRLSALNATSLAKLDGLDDEYLALEQRCDLDAAMDSLT